MKEKKRGERGLVSGRYRDGAIERGCRSFNATHTTAMMAEPIAFTMADRQEATAIGEEEKGRGLVSSVVKANSLRFQNLHSLGS